MRNTLPSREMKRGYVKSMFGRIADRYDLMNRIMSLGQDSTWRRKAVQKLQPEKGNLYLDLGAGTGDLSHEIIRQAPGVQVIAADLTIEMILYGKGKKDDPSIQWLVADAQALPFCHDSFSGVISGYLLRNVPEIDSALREQIRVISQKSKIVCLDTTPPTRNVLYPFIMIYLRGIIPIIGKIISGDSQAYAYLPESTRKHASGELLVEKLRSAGFKSIGFVKLMFGTMAIHWGEK